MTALTARVPKQLSTYLPKRLSRYLPKHVTISLPTHTDFSLPSQLKGSLPKQMKMPVPKDVNRYAWPAGLLVGAAAAALFFGRRARANGRTVGDVMVDDVLTVDASEALWKAAQLMRDGNVGVLPVVEDGKLRGIVTDRDLVIRGLAEGADPSGMRVGDCATWDIVCARAESPVEEAMEVMAECQIGRLPVVDADNRVIGIMTLSSLALRSRKKDDALETAQEVSKRSARAAA
jgi:CBS domain-containing protein